MEPTTPTRGAGASNFPWSDAAQRLSAKRHEVATRIEQAIVAELARLGMPHSRFAVHFAHEPDPAGWIALPPGSPSGHPDGERFAAFPVKVAMLSRFVAKAEQAPPPTACQCIWDVRGCGKA